VPHKSGDAIATPEALQAEHNRGQEDFSKGNYDLPYPWLGASLADILQSTEVDRQQAALNDAYRQGQKNAESQR
jgi:hypothetical protein